MGTDAPQATYAVGRGKTVSYIYSKYCNHDSKI